jgi:hypothetical protein
MGDEKEAVAVSAEDAGGLRLAQAGGALRHRVEHRLDVRRRARDDSEDLARRCLLRQGLGQLRIARLQLLEQADVLDGDDGLIGESLKERHFRVREPARLPTVHSNSTDGRAVA